jgi:hypothetical protein
MTGKFPYTSAAAWEFHTSTEDRELVNWVARTRGFNGGQVMYVAEIVYVMRRAGYTLDEIRSRLTYLIPRKED